MRRFRQRRLDEPAGRGHAVLDQRMPPPANDPAPSSAASAPAGIFLPREHGSWSLALEPLALGLLCAPSLAGGALALGAVAGFFARRPLRLAFTADSSARRRLAGAAFVLFALLALAGAGVAAALHGVAALWPLLLAAPLGALFVWFDTQGDSRAAAAELAGSATYAVLPAALAVLAGWPAATALALAGIALARNTPTVLTVRAYLRLGKRQPADTRSALLTAGVATGALGLLAIKHLVPWVAAALAVLLAARTFWLVTPLRPDWPARRVGQLEAVLGTAYVVSIATAYHLH